MNQKKMVVSLLASAMLISSTSGIALAASTSTSKQTSVSSSNSNASKKTTTTKQVVHTLGNLAPVKLTARSTVKLADVNILTQNDGNVVTYTLSYTNNDSTPMMMIDYWSKVKTSGGTLFSPKLITKDSEKKTISPGSTVDLTYVMKVGRDVKLSDLNFLIVKWDFSQSNYERVIGKFNVPASYSISTPVGKPKTVRLSDSTVKVKVSGIKVFPGEDKNQYVKIGVNLNNISYKLLENPNIKWILRTPGGTNYPLTPDKDSASVSIQAQSSKLLSLMASIPTSVKMKNSELLLVEEQGEEKSVLPVASLQLPEASKTNVEVAGGQPNMISVDGQQLSTLLSTARVRTDDGEYTLNIQWVLKNEGKKAIKVPTYTFEVRTVDGTIYPIETKALDALKLAPGDIKTIKLSGSLQGDGDTSKIKLYVMSPTNKSESTDSTMTSTTPTNGFVFSYPVGVYAIPESISAEDGLTTETVIRNNKGTFGVSMGSLQRLPWIDSDVVAAKVTIRNAGTKTVQLPELEGMFTIDSAKIDGDKKLIYTHSGKLLGVGMTTEAYLLTKIPSDLRMSRLELSLNEKVSEEETNEWVTMNTSGLIQPVSYVGKGKRYTTGIGDKETEMGVRRTIRYSGSLSDIVYTEFEMTNKSQRQSGLGKMVGYFKSSDGQYYRATAKQSDRQPGPGQKSIVTFWAKLPKSVKFSDLRLIVGEGIADSKFVTGEGEATAYVNALAYEVPPISINMQGSLSNIDLYPYNLTANSVRAYLAGSSSLQVEMNYTLSRNEEIEIGDNEHKLIFTLTDQAGKSYEKELTLGTDIKTGINETLSWNIESSFFEKVRGGSYRLSVDDQFQGQRIRLAEQSYGYDLTKLPKEE